MEQQAYIRALAHLFYAVAAADRRIEAREIQALQRALSMYWENEPANEIQSVFEALFQQPPAGREAFEVFKDYFLAHAAHYSASERQRIFKTADAIASAFSNKNKSELVVLSKLQLLK
jgi:uncharacterized tellurite resistance protein B-like protein